MKFLAGLATLMLSLSSHAIVDLRNANYSNTWIDIQVDGSGYDMKVLRTYHSRSLFNGMFGFGWCSNFETSVEILPEGSLKVRECGTGATTVYSPREITKGEVEKVISQIMAKVRADKKVGVSEEYYKKLTTELFDNPTKRLLMADQYGLRPAIKEGTKFYANGHDVEYMQLDKDYYTRYLTDGTMQRFDKEGRLLALYDKNNHFLKFKYEKDLLKEIEDNLGRRMAFKFYPNKKVKEIMAPNGYKAEYKFANMDDLVWVKNAWKNQFSYEYDDGHNMTKAIWPDKTFYAMKYNKKEDWVISLQDRDKCVENYSYETSKSDPQYHYWSTLKKTCGKKVVADDRYEFWHKQRGDGEVILQRILTKIGGNTTDITFDEQNGKPLAVRKNAEKVTYDYFPNGLVKTKATNNTRMTFEYHSELKKIIAVTTTFYNEKGENIAKKDSQFKYDTKGNLISAQNSDGQVVVMTYDNLGRITSITDQAKKVVKIEYEERFGKPFVVTRPGLGSIKINYKANGDMKEVESPQGPSVALQVASTFNNYLDVMAPATQEMYM
jgi:YD repeat-containing protein